MTSEIEARMRAYYNEYYREMLGLPDWEKRVASRLHEHDLVEPRLAELRILAGERYENARDVLVVGGGTGAEFLAMARRGCTVTAVEPNPEAVAIARLRANEAGIDPEGFHEGVGEDLPYGDAAFDLVLCLSVLEHVRDIEQTVREMVRVTRPGGIICVIAPDYRQWYESHYKLVMPMSAPRWLLKLYLAIRGRPTAFLDTLQQVTQPSLTRVLRKLPVVAARAFSPWPDAVDPSRPHERSFVQRRADRLGMPKDQYWVLVKIERDIADG